MQAFFTHWQRKYIGRMLTFLLGVLTAVVVVWLLVELVQAISFLQPVLIPLAIAAVLAFLAEPVVRAVCARTRLSRTWVVLILMGLVVLMGASAGVWIVPRAYEGAVTAAHDTPAFMKKAEDRLFSIVNATQRKVSGFNKGLPPLPAGTHDAGTNKKAASDQSGNQPSPAPTSADGTASGNGASPPAEQKKKDAASTGDYNQNGSLDPDDLRVWLSGELPKLGQEAPMLLQRAGQVILKTLGGFMGAFGVILNAIIIPIYIFFLLTEARNIAKRWADFLPLKDSQFKQEIVSTLGEINGYLVAFFRGQLIVSTIDATLIGLCLWLIVGLKFSAVIALLVLVLTFIPYLGIMLCYIPAVLIAVVQFGDWQHPLYVICIMFGVQTLESTIIAPKIVGESTGLHPLTVIVSVFAWELIIGGPIGALLAVPLTAALKVIMRRYVWERARVRSRILPTADVAPVLRAGDRDRFGDGGPDIQAVPDAVAHPEEQPIAPANAETANPPSGKHD